MPEPRRDLDLLDEAVGADAGGELRAQHLHRDAAAVLEILGEIHARHPARADLALDAVARAQRVDERVGGEGGHGANLRLAGRNVHAPPPGTTIVRMSLSRRRLGQRSAARRRASAPDAGRRWRRARSGCTILAAAVHAPFPRSHTPSATP